MNTLQCSEPRNQAVQPESRRGSLPSGESARTAKTLLVVDDEPSLRELEVEILKSSGFHVLESECMAEALQLAATTAPIDLLLTDFSLPDGNGLDLARRCRQFHPQTPIILASGSLLELEGGVGGLDHFALMQKPFTFQELLSLIRALLADTTLPVPSSRLTLRPNPSRSAAATD